VAGSGQVGDEDVDTKNVGEVSGVEGLWCSSGFGSSPGNGSGGSSSLATKQARPRGSETVRR
jgi:hypothetical protein